MASSASGSGTRTGRHSWAGLARTGVSASSHLTFSLIFAVSSAVQLLVFYTLFYLCLAAFWCLALLLFMQTIDYKYPKWQLDESRIGTNPGLGFRPRPSSTKVETTLIWFKSGTSDNSYNNYVKDLEDYLKPYSQETGDAIGRGETVASPDDCKNPGFEPPAGKFCPFNYKDTFSSKDESCNKENKYGYQQGKPCVLVKINKVSTCCHCASY